MKMASGSAASEDFHQWKFFDSMQFLRDYLELKPTSSNYQTFEEEFECLEEYAETVMIESQDPIEDTSSPEKPLRIDVPKKKKRLFEEAHEKICGTMESLNSLIGHQVEKEQRKTEEEGDCDGCYKFIESLLKRVDDDSGHRSNWI
ncbi:uncharacterized protein [Musca autumnalis]|uniref:uncharacterized protein n=1 Tax=Musca autumnalis TaxID=221902 RepID=UPI003CF482CC